MKNPVFSLLTLLLFALGCEQPRPGPVSESAPSEPDNRPVVLCLGNSLTAAYGLDLSDGWVALLQKRVDSLGLGYRLINAGVSGETTSGLRSRMGWMLQGNIHTVIVESGANDGLRGTELTTTRDNLSAIIDTIRVFNPAATVILAGMLVPPNMGPDYSERFRKMYPGLAREKNVLLIPYFLDGVGGNPDLNLPDGIHPNQKGQKVVAETVWKVLGPVLQAQPPLVGGMSASSSPSETGTTSVR
ncbi:MAG: arylesterase [Bacteroidetes bacterium]|nr:arylesterase [Bacteroidota bacterium]